MSTVDIDDALTEIRQLLASRTDASEPSRLADLFEAVDAHMSNGGALPADWRTKSPCHI